MRIGNTAIRRLVQFGAVLGMAVAVGSWTVQARAAPRLYVIDCGQLNRGEPTRYELTSEEVADTNFSDPCFFIVHPQGTLLWDLGIIPDGEIEAGRTVQPPEGGVGSNQAFRSLRSQLRELGYEASDVTHVAFSHYHSDHVANANDYAGALWMVQRVEWLEMFSEEGRQRSDFAKYRVLEGSKTLLLNGDHDVFGDGSVVILATPGHTVGHQSLMVRLANHGPVILSGDLYHYAAERELGRMPTGERQRGTPESRARIERLASATGGQLWIQHDIIHYADLKRSPQYYD